jgi:hypothetical protein
VSSIEVLVVVLIGSIMPRRFILRMVIVVSVSLLALILNAEGKLFANETPLLMLLVVLFMAGGTALNFVQIQRWRRQQVDREVSLESSKRMIVEDTERVKRYYRRWLIAMPVFYLTALFGERQMPVLIRVCFTAFAICAFSYVLLLYKRASPK